MTDLSEMSERELQDLYLQQAAKSPRITRVTPTPSITYRREHDPTSAEWQEKYGPTAGEGEGQLTLEGVGRGIANVGRHIGNLMSMSDVSGMSPQERFLAGMGVKEAPATPAVSDAALKEAAALDAPLMNTPGGRFGSIGGETAALTPAMLASSGAAGATGLGAAVVGNPITRGIAEGALQGGVMADPGERLKGALMGAATGGALPAAGAVGSKLAYGVTRTPEAQELMDRGVRLTPGQMNPEGVINKIEENVRGFPVVGNIVENARSRAQQDFQRGVIEEAAAPGYKLQSKSTDPNELFQEAQDSYKPLYKAAEGFKVQPMDLTRNQTLARSLRDAANNKAVGAGAEIRQSAQDFLEGQFQAAAEKAQSTGGWKSQHLISLRSGINEEIRGAGQDQAGKKYAQLLRAARDRVTDSINSQIPPDAAKALQTANDAYPKLAVIRDAIKRGGDQEQGFTPAQLSQSVRQATENNEYARGGGLLRDWSAPGREIFTERNPKTGHAFGTAGVLGYLGLHHPIATLPAAAAGLGLVGTDAGRALVSGQTAPQQATQKLIEALQRSTTPGQRELTGVASRAALNRAVPYYVLPRSSSTEAGTGTP